MSVTANILFLIGAYLLGSFPYMFILIRSKGVSFELDEDFHLLLWRRVGRAEAISGILLDAGKGALPVIIGFYAHFDIVVLMFAGVLAVAGQMWPVFLKFNGEKGNTTGMGMVVTYGALYQDYTLLIITISIILLGFLVRTVPRLLAAGQSLNEKMKLGGPSSNSVPLAMIAAFAVVPLIVWLTGQPDVVIIAFAVLFVAIVVRRLTAGLRADLKEPAGNTASILLMRLLFDRSRWEKSFQYYTAPSENEDKE